MLVGLGDLEGADRCASTAMQTDHNPAKSAALADLGNVRVAQREASEAVDLAEQAVRRHTLDGPFDESEMFARLVLIRALGVAKSPTAARRAAAEARARLAVLAARITDEALRKSFLTRVPEHVAIERLASL